MGTPFQATNPWLGAAQVGDALGNTIAQTAIALPRARLEGDMMRAQMQRMQIESQIAQQQAPLHSALLAAQAQASQAQALAHLGQQEEYGAHAKLYNAQAGEVDTQGKAQFELGQAAANLVKSALTNNGHVDPNAAAEFGGKLFLVHKMDPNVMENIVRTLALSTSGIGGTNQALNNAVASGTKVPERMNVPPGNMNIDPSNPSANPFLNPTPPGNAAESLNPLLKSIFDAANDPVASALRDTNSTPSMTMSNMGNSIIDLSKQLRAGGLGRQAAPQTNQIPTVLTKPQYDALPSGTVYIGEDGKKYKKP